MNKRAILKRIKDRISDNHESMDTGLEHDTYMRKVGANEELKDLRDFVVELPDADDVDGELEDLE